MIAKEIRQQAMEVKALVQKSMSAEAVERATDSLNAILAEAERVAGLEAVAQMPEGERC